VYETPISGKLIPLKNGGRSLKSDFSYLKIIINTAKMDGFLNKKNITKDIVVIILI